MADDNRNFFEKLFGKGSTTNVAASGFDAERIAEETRKQLKMKIWRDNGRRGAAPFPELFTDEDTKNLEGRATFFNTVQKARDRGIVGANRNTLIGQSILGTPQVNTGSAQGGIVGGEGASGSIIGGDKGTSKGPTLAKGPQRGGGSFKNGILSSKKRQQRILG